MTRIGKPAGLARQRGVAVITALLLTTLAITIVASLFWQQQVQVRSIENQRMQLQKEWVLRGALDWARMILREDARLSPTDHLGEPWAVNLAETRLDQYVDNGSKADADVGDAALSGAIVDAQSRYNLTNLSNNGKIDPVELAAFAKLLTNLRLDPALAAATAKMMAASQPKVIDLVAPGATADLAGTASAIAANPVTAANPATAGAGASGTIAGSDSTASKSMKLTELDDLFALPGFKEETMRKLKDYVVVLPVRTAVNVNTASAEVISARIATVSLADATAIVASRERAYFNSPDDFKTRDRLKEKELAASANDIAVVTKFFLVTGKVRMSRGSLEVQALIQRDAQTTRLLSVRQK